MKLGIIGFPLSHTVSPAMQTAALEAAGIAGSYRVLETNPAFFRARLQEVRRGYRGVNVTIPFKEQALAHLDELTSEARAIGAVNTVINDSGRLTGANTDAGGFVSGLDEAGISYSGRKVLVLGAGGAARAIVYALRQEGAQVAVYNRSGERAKELCAQLGAHFVSFALLETAVRSCHMLVNTTSVGLKDPTASPLEPGLLPKEGVVVDIVYNPAQTKLMLEAEAAGLKVLGGLPMLVWQGALAFEYWTGQKANVRAMYEAARMQLA